MTYSIRMPAGSAALIAIAISAPALGPQSSRAETITGAAMPVISEPAAAAEPAPHTTRPDSATGAAMPVISEPAAAAAPTPRKAASRTREARRHTARKGRFSIERSCLPAGVRAKLATIEKRWGPVRIVSTFRKGAVVAGSGTPSMHASCRAVDFHPAPGTYKAVLGWLKANHKGGLGTYSCAMHHLHIDNGPQVRWHHCVNKRGRPVRRGG